MKQLEAAGIPYELASAISILGRAYEQKSEWDQASKYYQKALRMRMQLGDLPGVAQSYNNLGDLYQAMGHWEEALDCLKSNGCRRRLGISCGYEDTTLPDRPDRQPVGLYQGLTPPAKIGGRPRIPDMRKVINGILYLVVGGIQWRMLPREYPNWRVSTTTSAHGATTGPGDASMRRCVRCVGAKDGINIRLPAVSTARVSRRRQFPAYEATTPANKSKAASGTCSYTLGLLLVDVDTAASVQDRDGARTLLRRLPGTGKKPRRIWVDGGYRGQFLDWVAARCPFRLQVVLRPEDQKGFAILPRRRVVERTLAWLNHHRRLSKDYEVQILPAKP